MRIFRFFLIVCAAGLVSSVLLVRPRQAHGYVEQAHSLGQVVNLSSNVVVMKVTSVDRTKNAIIFAKVKDIKGVHKQTEIRHNIGQAGFEPREWKNVMAWADVGKEAIFFHNGGASETCIGNYWYQSYGNANDVNGWWGMSHAEPYLLRSFSGRTDKLAAAVTAMLEGKEVIVPCMVDGNLNDLKAQKARVQRMKASLKLNNYDAKRDFVGWGGEDFRRVQGMAGFTHISALSRVDPDSQSISTVDFDGDGKMDLCLAGAGRVALLKNDGEALGEVSLPSASGCRAAVWGDYNGDGLPDLLLATPAGPKLFTNLGKGAFRDDTHLLPREAGYNLTCAAWIDQDGDGRPDVLLGNGWYGLRLYRNGGKSDQKAPLTLGGWHVIGPFDYANGKAYDVAYPPEKALDLKGEYDGRLGKVKWKAGKFEDGVAHSLGFLPGGEAPGVAYLHRVIECDKATKLPIGLGSDDGIAVFVNGKRVHLNKAARGVVVDNDKITIDLKAGKNDLLLKIVNTGGPWGFAFSVQGKLPAHGSWQFTDVSDAVGLGEKGVAKGMKGDTLSVVDLDGDGKQDFLYGAGKGVVVRNTGKKFEQVTDAGIEYVTGKVGPVFGDFDGDGLPDLFVPQAKGCKLFRNKGKFAFEDVTKSAGLAEFAGRATSAAWGDVDNDGKLDLVVGVLRGCNRYFRNKGDGTFADCSAKIGLTTKVYNTQAVCLTDLNGDGVLDFVFNNEGQDPIVLLGDPAALGSKRTPVSLAWKAKTGVTGGHVRVLDEDGKLQGSHSVSGGDGRGGQASPLARFALPPGKYKLELRLSSGEKRSRELVVAGNHVRGTLE
jgi:hypothetical protein